MFKFKEVKTEHACVLSEENSNFRIEATKFGVTMTGTSPVFCRHSDLEGLGAAMGVAVRWHLNAVEAARALKVVKDEEAKADAVDTAGKF